MFHSIKNTFTNLLLLTALLISGNSSATTICALECPSTGGGSSGSALPQVLDIVSTDGSDLFLDSIGLITLFAQQYTAA